MNVEFYEIIERFPGWLDLLQKSPSFSKGQFGNLPDKGIYVFYDENDIPQYVGRSDRMKARLNEHSQPSSTHTSATFAFNLAKEIAEVDGIDTEIPRKELEKNPQFKKIYLDTKETVSKMKIRALEISDPIEQTLFEVYVHLELKTKNDFKNH